MLVTVLYRMEGEPAVEGQTHPFTDVDASRYYGDAITWAANSGVVNGMTDTRFAPEAAVTREQMVTILYRYAKLKDADVTAKGDLESFPDHDQVKPYARGPYTRGSGSPQASHRLRTHSHRQGRQIFSLLFPPKN